MDIDDERKELVEQLQLQLVVMQAQLHAQQQRMSHRHPHIQDVFQPRSTYDDLYDMGFNAMEWRPPLEYENHFNNWSNKYSYSIQEDFQGGNQYHQCYQRNMVHPNLSYRNPNNALQPLLGFSMIMV